MQKIFITVIVSVVSFWSTIASAQSADLQDALKTAKELQSQENLIEALETLMAITPIATETNSPEYDIYDEDTDVSTNTFYLKDTALEKLVGEFITKQQFDNAITAAQCIANPWSQNSHLLTILRNQCGVARYKPDEFNRLIAEAEKTAMLVGDGGYLEIAQQCTSIDKFTLATEFLQKVKDANVQSRGYLSIVQKHVAADKFDLAIEFVQKMKDSNVRSSGYLLIARKHFAAGKFDLAIEFLKKMENVINRDAALMNLASSIWQNKFESNRTPENENLIRSMVDLVQSPLKKAEGLYQVTEFIRKPERKEQRLKIFQDATKLLIPLPDNLQKTELLLQIHDALEADGWKTEALAMRKPVFASIGSITDKDKQFNLYASFYRHDQPDAADTIREMQKWAENSWGNPYGRIYRWETLVNLESRSPIPLSDVRKNELIGKIQQLPFTSGHSPHNQIALLKSLYSEGRTETEVNVLVLNAIMDIGNANVNTRSLWHEGYIQGMQSCIYDLAKQDMDKMFEVVFSPKMPEVWKTYERGNVYEGTARMLIRILTDQELEAHAKNFYKLLDLIESPQKKYDIFDDASMMHEKLQTRGAWNKRIEYALAIPVSKGRFLACNTVLYWAQSSHKPAKWNGDNALLPSLIDAMEKIAVAEANLPDKVMYYEQTLARVREQSLWDEKKITDWRERYEALRNATTK